MVRSISPGLTSILPAYKGWMECQGAQTSSKVNREEILTEKKDKHNTNRTENHIFRAFKHNKDDESGHK